MFCGWLVEGANPVYTQFSAFIITVVLGSGPETYPKTLYAAIILYLYMLSAFYMLSALFRVRVERMKQSTGQISLYVAVAVLFFATFTAGVSMGKAPKRTFNDTMVTRPFVSVRKKDEVKIMDTKRKFGKNCSNMVILAFCAVAKADGSRCQIGTAEMGSDNRGDLRWSS